MPINQDRINYLLTQWLGRNITEPELHELSELLMQGRHDQLVENAFQTFISQLPDEGYTDYKEADWEHLWQKIIQTQPATVINMEGVKQTKRFSLLKIAVAASILLIIGLGIAALVGVFTSKKQDSIVTIDKPADVQ